MVVRTITKSVKETQKLATDLAQDLLKGGSGEIYSGRNQRIACVVALQGELGAGKTTFVQGFARALGVKSAVRSPTFVLIKIYPIKSRHKANKSSLKINSPKAKKATNYKLLYHIDCYRVRDHRDLLPLGIKEILTNPANIILIEWAERVRQILPRKVIKINFEHVNKDERLIRLTAH